MGLAFPTKRSDLSVEGNHEGPRFRPTVRPIPPGRWPFPTRRGRIERDR